MKQYRLSQHVCLCVIDGDFIVLDLKKNKYSGLSGIQMREFGTVLYGWPSEESYDKNGSTEKTLAIARELVSAGVLTESENGKSAAPVRVDPVQETLVEKGAKSASIRQLDILRFTMAFIYASICFKYFSMERMVNAARSRKERRGMHGSLDLDTARRAMSVFRRLRPFFFTVRDACLFDSLCLTRFLAFYGLYPIWVIGVSTRPFTAHSWVQHGTFVFNGTPDAVSFYKPIEII